MSAPHEGVRRWLLVCEAPFAPMNDGGQREHAGMIRAVRAHGHLAGVVLFVRDEDEASRHRHLLDGIPLLTLPRSFAIGSYVHPVVPFVWASRPCPRRLVEGWARQVDFDAVLACSSKSAGAAARIARWFETPLAVRQHNIEGRYHRDLGAGSGLFRRAYFRWEARRIERVERALESEPLMTGTAEISAIDLRERVGPRRRVLVPPFAVDVAERQVDDTQAAPGRVVFLGALDIPTNEHGLRWFLNSVWPRVLELRPSSELFVGGRRPSARFERELRSVPGVETEFDIEDPTRFIRSGSVAVNPTVSGSGTNIKLVEYMACGRPVVATSRSIGSLPDLDPSSLMTADEPSDFAHAVVWLLDHREAADRMGTRASDEARRKFGAAAGVEALGSLLNTTSPGR